MIDVDTKLVLEKKLERFLQLGPKAVGWATADAMTSAGKDAADHMKRIAPLYIERPTPFTLKSIGRWPGYVKPETLNQWIGFKKPDNRPEHYLEPMTSGGNRPQKRSEWRLSQTRAPGRYIVPTNKAPIKLNRYGNVPEGAMTQVLSRLKAFNTAGATQNVSRSRRSQRKRKDRDFFAAKVPGTSTAGIYVRLNRRKDGTQKIRPVFILTNRQPRYHKTFPARELIRERYLQRFSAALTLYLRRKL